MDNPPVDCKTSLVVLRTNDVYMMETSAPTSQPGAQNPPSSKTLERSKARGLVLQAQILIALASRGRVARARRSSRSSRSFVWVSSCAWCLGLLLVGTKDHEDT